MELHKLSTTYYTIKTWGEKFPDQNINLLSFPINSSWKPFFEKDSLKEPIERINKYLSHCLKVTNNTVNIFPYPDLLFSAFNATPLERTKVVILGQDPYFNWESHGDKNIPQAMGLSFSVPIGIEVPSSLENIYKNLIKFGHLKKKPTHGNLTFWAYQGCLLLNTVLTVQHKHPNGHEKFWTQITDALIEYISNNTENIVFMLWGSNALGKLDLIDKNKHMVIVSSHPSGLSYSKPLRNYKPFSETDHFGKANEYLMSVGKHPILWQIL